MMVKRFTYLVAALSLLFACGKKTTENENSAAKKIFRYNQAEGLSSLDPAFARDQANTWAVNQVYNGLYEMDKELSVVPALVETWNISEDGKTYTFNIRKGVNFHDDPAFAGGKGREVTADDFIYSFKRILDPKTASPGAWIFNDKILANTDGSISDTCFKKNDDYSFNVYLRKPFPPFLHILAMPYAYVVPKEAVEKYGKDFGRKAAIGTGPFTLKQWSANESMTLLKNQNYWRRDAADKPLPYLDAIQVTFIPDKNQAFRTFQQGKLEMLSGIEEGSRDLILNRDGSLRKEFTAQFQVERVPYLNTEYLAFQLDPSVYSDKKHPFLDKRVRQALSYAINRDELVSFLRNKLGAPGVSGMVPVAMPSFDSTKVRGYEFNIEKAQKLLREAGYSKGKAFPEITLYCNPLHNELMQYLQKQWANVGVNVKIEITNQATLQEMADGGKVQFWRASWIGDYPDAENYLATFYSKNAAPVGPNKTRFKNATFDQLYEKAQLENDPFERYEMYQLMDQIIMTECPVIVLFYDEGLQLKQNYVAGLEANPMNNLSLERVDFKEVSNVKITAQ